MARTGVMEYRINRSYVPNRSQLLLLIAFIIQGYVAYRYGVRSAKNDNHKILPPTPVPQKPLSNAAALADTPTIWSPTTTISAASSSSKFILGSMNDKPNSYDLLVISNKLRYAATHNYDIVWDFDKSSSSSNSNSEPSYSKDWDRLTTMAKIIQNKLAGQNSYEWIWWTDYDLIVTNFSITLDSVVREALEQQQQHVEEDVTRREEIDLIMTPDCFPVNSGSLLVRTSAWSLEWIGEMWRQRLVVSEEDGRWRSLQDCLGVSIFLCFLTFVFLSFSFSECKKRKGRVTATDTFFLFLFFLFFSLTTITHLALPHLILSYLTLLLLTFTHLIPGHVQIQHPLPPTQEHLHPTAQNECISRRNPLSSRWPCVAKR